MVVVVWSGAGNISFSYENGLVWIWFGFVPICKLRQNFLETEFSRKVLLISTCIEIIM